MKTTMTTIALGLGAAMVASGAVAATNLVQNGAFSSFTQGGTHSIFIRNANDQLTDWSYYAAADRNNGVSAVLTPGDTGMTDGGGAHYSLWSAANGGTGTIPTNPPSGANNTWASDGASENLSSLGQSVGGLTPGARYAVTFNWAAAQLRNDDCGGCLWNGATDESWSVNLGGAITGDNVVTGGTTQSTGFVSNLSHGFGGWQSAKMIFTANSSTENLFFTAVSHSSGLPPFALLDNVQLDAFVPEPATWAMMLVGVAGLGALARRRRAASLAAA